jgi:hypothetical protein
MENKFPEIYPCDLYDRIIQDGGANNKFDKVYRVASYGVINRDAFLATFEESELPDAKLANRDMYLATLQKDYDIGDYSVSFYEKRQDARKILRLKKRHYDGPVLIYGVILPEHGMSIRTKESTDPNRRTTNSHVDLWKYENTDMTNLFEIEEVQ